MKSKSLALLIITTLLCMIYLPAMAVDNQTIIVNGQTLGIKGKVENNYLMVGIGPGVTWDQSASTVTINDFMTRLADVSLTASIDGTLQHSLYYATTSTTPKPLIIWLHTWGNDYQTIYEANGKYMSEEAISRDWNYIQPNFRGPNNNPDACGSTKAIADIDDAINYALAHGNVDTTKIYIVGASGGGHAGLMHFMKSTRTDIKQYILWVPMSDIMGWFYQCADKGYTSYFYDIAYSVQCDGYLNVQEAQNRSPVFQTTPVSKFNYTKLSLLAGINDGYNGAAIPFSQSVYMYNKLCKDRGLNSDRVSYDEVFYMITNHQPSVVQELGSLAECNRKIWLKKTVPNLELTIFEGAHEMFISDTFTMLGG